MSEQTRDLPGDRTHAVGDEVKVAGKTYRVAAVLGTRYWSQSRVDDEDEFDRQPGHYTTYRLVPVEQAKPTGLTPKAAKLRIGELLRSPWAVPGVEAMHDRSIPADVVGETHVSDLGSKTRKVVFAADATWVELQNKSGGDPPSTFRLPPDAARDEELKRLLPIAYPG